MRHFAARGAIIGRLIGFLVIGAVGYFAFVGLMADPKADKLKLELSTPDRAFKHYVATAYFFMHNDPQGTFDDVKNVVTSEDWNWYQVSYNSLHSDTFGLGTAIDPIAADAIARRSALMSLLENGPNRTDTEILSSSQTGMEAKLHVKYLAGQDLDGQPRFKERDVTLVKRGKIWLVKDFAGGRSALNR